MSGKQQLELRFGDVAYALGMAGNTNPLRNWLRRGQVTIEAGYGGGWAKFSFRDLVALVIFQLLVRYNIGVERARVLTERALSAVWRDEYSVKPHLATQPSNVAPKAPPPLPPRLIVFTDSDGNEHAEWGMPGHLVDADCWLAIDVHRAVSSALIRARESVAERQERFEETLQRGLKKLAKKMGKELDPEEEKHLMQQLLEEALRIHGVAVEYQPDGSMKAIGDTSEQVSPKLRKRKAMKR